MKVCVIGARCRRQGIGEHVARCFDRAGAEVSAVVGTSAETAAEAADNLRRRYGIACRSFSALAPALKAERPDIVAVCSPYEHHREQLDEAAAAAVHCLCEKPMWWGPEPRKREETERLVRAFASRGRHLALVTQWPCTLGAYFQLFPELQGRRVETFRMTLGPASTGPRMVLDAAPHAVSMLQRLCGPGAMSACEARFPSHGPERAELVLDFDYVHAAGRTQSVLCLVTSPERPRPASYAVNGCEAERRIDLRDYAMRLEARERSVPFQDPLETLVVEFLRDLADRVPINEAALAGGMEALAVLHGAAEKAWKSGAGARTTAAVSADTAGPNPGGICEGGSQARTET